jgi:hypothetical protein
MTVWDTSEYQRELTALVDTYDRTGVESLIDRLIGHLHASDEVYPAPAARAVLRQLRRKRLFGLVTRTADAFLQSGQRDSGVRCEYAQALNDQGMPAAAVEMLSRVLAE